MTLKKSNLKKKTTPLKAQKTTITTGLLSKELPPKMERNTLKKTFIDSEEIPANYNKTSLTLVARDPYWIYAHWEITPASIDHIKREIGQEFEGSVFTLRMYDITLKNFDGTNANNWFDKDINPSAGNWYINLSHDNVTYCGALGIRTRQGNFHPLARSNFVTTPCASSSWRRDMIWMEVPPPSKDEEKNYYPRRPFVMVGRSDTASQPPKGKKFRQRVHLTAHDIRAYYYNLFPLLRLLRAKHLSGGRKWDLGRLSRKDLESSSFIHGLHPTEQYYKKIRVGASEELVLVGGASEQLKGASEKIPPGRKFFFEIGTELIVYGRTEPDAEVRLGDKIIKLREDGTFSLRFALPDGDIPLDFTATSNDKVEQRKIITSVHRTKTMYSP